MSDELVEGAHVGALMDVGVKLTKLNRMAEQKTGRKFGHGYKDQPHQDHQIPDPQYHAVALLNQDPESWYTLVRAQLLLTQTADSPKSLRAMVAQVAAMAVGWLADLDERAEVNNR